MLLKKEGVIIKHLLIDLYIKNNEEEHNYENIPCKYIDNKYVFNIEHDEYEIEIKENIVFHKKNNESIIDFIFENNKTTEGTYFINELNFYMDAKVKTIKYTINDNNIDIEYKLWLQDEEIGDFIFKLHVRK